MKYKVSLLHIENTFRNCWEVVCQNLDKTLTEGISDGERVEQYFNDHYKIKLLYELGSAYQIDPLIQFGWSHVEFNSKEDFVMFMLEWS
jgi:hypothetical protein